MSEDILLFSSVQRAQALHILYLKAAVWYFWLNNNRGRTTLPLATRTLLGFHAGRCLVPWKFQLPTIKSIKSVSKFKSIEFQEFIQFYRILSIFKKKIAKPHQNFSLIHSCRHSLLIIFAYPYDDIKVNYFNKVLLL